MVTHHSARLETRVRFPYLAQYSSLIQLVECIPVKDEVPGAEPGGGA